ncbi:MAG: XRE family transcriptional regulator [Thermomicrobiales bacterium]
MTKSLEDLIRERPVDRSAVDALKKRMLEQVAAYRLSDLRKAMDVTRVALAERLHVSQNRVSRIEKGDLEHTQIDTLRKYVEAIGGRLHVEVELADERILIA